LESQTIQTDLLALPKHIAASGRESGAFVLEGCITESFTIDFDPAREGRALQENGFLLRGREKPRSTIEKLKRSLHEHPGCTGFGELGTYWVLA
jgi:hypothetical protein